VAGAKALLSALEKNSPPQGKRWFSACCKTRTGRRFAGPRAIGRAIFTVPVASERTPRARNSRRVRAANPAAEIAACDSLRRALEQVRNDRFVVVTGSLYLVGEALNCWAFTGNR